MKCAPSDAHAVGFSGWLDARECGASGSEFETMGAICAGANRIDVADVGDFGAGQYVTVSRCHTHYEGYVYNEKAPYHAANMSRLSDEIEIRGFTREKEWQVFVLHFEDAKPAVFSWLVVDHAHQPLVRRWTWQGRNVPVTGEWTPLMDGVEIRFKKTDWLPGQAISFHARNRLVTRITEVRGKTLVLENPATENNPAAVVRHLDQFALQAALDKSVAEKKALFIPAGRYRLTMGLLLKDAVARVEGEHRDNTILDISDGTGAVFTLRHGKDVTVRNVLMMGHTGYNELPWYSFRTATGFSFWPTANQQMEVKGCAAGNIYGTERVLFEDVKVTRMSAEAFYSWGPSRSMEADAKAQPQPMYTKTIVYHRCAVFDSASNAFNNNDFAENTSILHCHVERVHNFWEGANRFTRVIGNYVRYGHCGSYGNCSRGSKAHLRLGTGQAVISGNVFEGGDFGRGINIGRSPTQVIISNNMFVNFSNSNAITIDGMIPRGSRPARYVTITGNIIDLTHVEGQLDIDRAGVSISAPNVIVSDNQIYLRGAVSRKSTGILVGERATNVVVHDNLIENCAYGFRAGTSLPDTPPDTGIYQGEVYECHAEVEVAEALNDRSFRAKDMPGAWDYAEKFQGWVVRWTAGANTGTTSFIESYDPESDRVALKDALPVKAGDRFHLYPSRANWNIHDNTIVGCSHPLELKGYGSETSWVKNNMIVQGSATEPGEAIETTDGYRLWENMTSGF